MKLEVITGLRWLKKFRRRKLEARLWPAMDSMIVQSMVARCHFLRNELLERIKKFPYDDEDAWFEVRELVEMNKVFLEFVLQYLFGGGSWDCSL